MNIYVIIMFFWKCSKIA